MKVFEVRSTTALALAALLTDTSNWGAALTDAGLVGSNGSSVINSTQITEDTESRRALAFERRNVFQRNKPQLSKESRIDTRSNTFKHLETPRRPKKLSCFKKCVQKVKKRPRPPTNFKAKCRNQCSKGRKKTTTTTKKKKKKGRKKKGRVRGKGGRGRGKGHGKGRGKGKGVGRGKWIKKKKKEEAHRRKKKWFNNQYHPCGGNPCPKYACGRDPCSNTCRHPVKIPTCDRICANQCQLYYNLGADTCFEWKRYCWPSCQKRIDGPTPMPPSPTSVPPPTPVPPTPVPPSSAPPTTAAPTSGPSVPPSASPTDLVSAYPSSSPTPRPSLPIRARLINGQCECNAANTVDGSIDIVGREILSDADEEIERSVVIFDDPPDESDEPDPDDPPVLAFQATPSQKFFVPLREYDLWNTSFKCIVNKDSSRNPLSARIDSFISVAIAVEGTILWYGT